MERKLPLVVAELEGVVAVYAYASPYRPREAYGFTVEDSIYLDPAYTGKGMGRLLLSAVILECKRVGAAIMRRLLACRKLGFEDAGLLANAGYEFDRWVNSVLMQRPLGAGATSRPVEIDCV